MYSPNKPLLAQADKAQTGTPQETAETEAATAESTTSSDSARAGMPRFKQDRIREAELLSQLIHKIGHEIGNPLTSIISLASIIERFPAMASTGGQNSDDDKTPSYAGSIISEAWRISALTERLVLLLSHRAGSPICHPATEAVNRTLEKLERREKLDCDLVRIRVHGTQSPNVIIDPDQLIAALSELVQNAYRAAVSVAPDTGSKDGPNLEVPIIIDLRPDDHWTIIQVTSFCSIACPYDLNAVFDPFITQFIEQKCLGLGLPMVVSVVERVGGKVSVSETAHGENFAFTTSLHIPADPSTLCLSEKPGGSLKSSASAIMKRPGSVSSSSPKVFQQSNSAEPLANSAEPLANSAEPLANSAETQDGPEDDHLEIGLPSEVKIFIVEDEPVVASAIRKILEISLGQYTRLSCRCLSGEQAVAAISAGEKFDCILCDLTLAGMSGRYVLETLIEQQPDSLCKFAFVTGDQSRKETQVYLESSQRPYLHKPFAPEELLALVLALITAEG